MRAPAILGRRGWVAVVALICWLSAGGLEARAATVTFSIVAVDADGSVLDGNEVIVQPGAEVPYILTAVVSSDIDVIDNDGLASFSIDLGTDLLVQQPPIDEFDPEIALWFAMDQSEGTPSAGPVEGVDEDVVGISGSQNAHDPGQVVPGVAAEQVQVIGRGRLRTPEVEGDFAAGILDSSAAGVFWPDSEDVYEARVAFDRPLKIHTRWPAAVSGVDAGKSGARTAKGSNTAQTTTTTTIPAWTSYVTLAAIAGGLIFVLLWGDGLLWLFGPLLAVMLGVMLLLGDWPTLE